MNTISYNDGSHGLELDGGERTPDQIDPIYTIQPIDKLRSHECADNIVAYNFAKREADIQASKQRVGHFLGIAPGCRAAGVGSSFSSHTPNHCTFNRTLIGRACTQSADGKWYWSAQYA